MSLWTGIGKRVLLTGRMSVGKSCLVNALWGISDLLPTATRDCTQANTLVSAPSLDESENVRIRFLLRHEAMKLIADSPSWHRISEFLRDRLGPWEARLDDTDIENSIVSATEKIKSIFDEDKNAAILNDALLDDITALNDFFLAVAPDGFSPKESAVTFADRVRYIMGERLANGSIQGGGTLLALSSVELRIQPKAFSGNLQIMDTPYIPPVHDQRRAALVHKAALDADYILMVSTSPELIIEPWLQETLSSNPHLASKISLVVNQVDTIDENRLFHRDGACDLYEKTKRDMDNCNMNSNNIFFTVPWLSHLKDQPQTSAITERISNLEKTLAQLQKKATSSIAPPSFAAAISSACSPSGGINPLREFLLTD